MKLNPICLIAVFIILMAACKTNTPEKGNLPAEGFDIANSDPAAIELADSIMAAMGGRQNWDDTQFISWNFFGNRELVWDKKMGRVRIESLRDSITYLLNLNTMEGKVSVKGQELPVGDSLNTMLKKAKSMWINDSYWLVMPFKLKDTGLTIKYLGEDTLSTGGKCNVMELLFKDVGDTPQNKYRIYIDLSDNLVKQWSYYKAAEQDSANFTRPWDNYKKYGDILLSGDRSDNSGPRNVRVDEALPDEVFTKL